MFEGIIPNKEHFVKEEVERKMKEQHETNEEEKDIEDEKEKKIGEKKIKEGKKGTKGRRLKRGLKERKFSNPQNSSTSLLIAKDHSNQ